MDGGPGPDVPCRGSVPEQECTGMKKHPHKLTVTRLRRRGSKSMSIDRGEHKEEIKSVKTTNICRRDMTMQHQHGHAYFPWRANLAKTFGKSAAER